MKVERSNPPQNNGEIKFHLPKFKRFKLNNGMDVLFLQKNHLPIVKISLQVNCGSKFDPKGKSGLAFLTSHLISEGAGEYNSLQLDEEIELLGTLFDPSTDNDIINLSMITLSDKFERSLELLALIYQSPLFSEEDFQREKQKLLSKIIQNKNEPSYVASSNFDKIIFGNSFYENSVLGKTEDVKTFTNNDVINFHKKYFVPNNSQLIVVGNLEKDNLKFLLNKYLYLDTINEIELVTPTFSVNHSPKFYFIHQENAAQSEIRVGHLSNRRNETDYFSKTLANSILGGQFSSRLNLNLREAKGFTYGIHSAFVYYKDVGYFEISTSVNGKDTGESILEIQKEIAGLKIEVTEEEINFTKSYFIKRFPSMFETNSQIAHNLSALIRYSLSESYFDNYIERISNCTKSEIEKSIARHIKADEMIYLVVGNREIVMPQLKKITDLEIVELDMEGKIFYF